MEALFEIWADRECSLTWLRRAENALRALRPRMLDELSASAAEWSDRLDGAAVKRSYLFRPVERFLHERLVHVSQLDDLLVDISFAYLGGGAEVPSLIERIGDWIHAQRELRSTDDELLFRLYWDDIGGEA